MAIRLHSTNRVHARVVYSSQVADSLSTINWMMHDIMMAMQLRKTIERICRCQSLLLFHHDLRALSFFDLRPAIMVSLIPSMQVSFINGCVVGFHLFNN